jgi:hypothetical protein
MITFRYQNHYKIKSTSNDNERRELAINGLPSAVVKPGNIIRPKDRRKDISSMNEPQI